VELDCKDTLWVEQRGEHIIEVFFHVEGLMKKMIAENHEIQCKNTNGHEMSTAEIGEMLRAQPLQEALNENYKKHHGLIGDVISEINGKRKIKKIIAAQQMIISGLEGSSSANNTKVVKRISSLNKMLYEVDYLRVLMIYFACYDLAPRDKLTMLKSIQKESYREAAKNMIYLDQGMRGEDIKFKRRATEQTREEFLDF